jgi:hypothetical protein
VDPNKVGSAGIPGWDDKMCQTVAQQSNDWGAEANQRTDNGDFAGAAVAEQISTDLQNKVINNCITVD